MGIITPFHELPVPEDDARKKKSSQAIEEAEKFNAGSRERAIRGEQVCETIEIIVEEEEELEAALEARVGEQRCGYREG